MQNSESKPLQSVLIISLGFAIIYLSSGTIWFLYLAFAIGFLGAISTFLAQKIDFLWGKLGLVLSKIIPPFLLMLIFFLLLYPIALLSRLFGQQDPLNLKKPVGSLLKVRKQAFTEASFEKTW